MANRTLLCQRFAVFALLLPLCAAAYEPVPFAAEYELFRNGKLKGKASLTFDISNDEWSMQSESRITRGFEKIFRIRDNETAQGQWAEGRVMPSSFHRDARAAGRDLGWSAEYNWDSKTVRTWHKDSESELDLEPGVFDPLSLGLVIRAGLDGGKQEWQVKMLDEDEIDDHLYQADKPQNRETALGCIETVTVERIREHSTRYTRSIHAKDWDFIPVRMEHGKTDGDQLELRIVSLKLDGETVEAGVGCP